VRLLQCYNTEYDADSRELAFNHVRTVTLSGDFDLERPKVMVGCSGVRLLFVLDDSYGPRDVIHRIDPISGCVEDAWIVDGNSETSVAGNDQLLLTINDRLEQYDTAGQLLRVIPTGLDLEASHRLRQSLLLPDSVFTLIIFQFLFRYFVVTSWLPPVFERTLNLFLID